jgi:hypothetical protein
MTAYRDRLEAGEFAGAPKAKKPDASWTDEATVDDLKDQLRDKGLPVTGTKAELLERLAENSD